MNLVYKRLRELYYGNFWMQMYEPTLDLGVKRSYLAKLLSDVHTI